MKLERLKKRRDFLAAAAARKFAAPGLLLQARLRAPDEPFTTPEAARVGFTASKKIGGAVERNRAKRRLRAAAREALAPQAKPGRDYVLIARPEATIRRPYAELVKDLALAFARVETAPVRPKAPPPSPPSSAPEPKARRGRRSGPSS